MNTVCLNMIVKDERHVILRCLASVKPFIDYWVIVDTGSTDGTQELIREFMQDIPGELFERPWVDFAYNRNLALELAKGKADYLLIMDADEKITKVGPFDKSALNKDCYFLESQNTDGTAFDRPNFIRNNPTWLWTGVIHEQLVSSGTKRGEKLTALIVERPQDGKRCKDPQTQQKDIKVLEDALIVDPNNSRYVFYLAQTYVSEKNFPMALKYYEQRASMPGDPDEKFLALFSTGWLQEKLEMNPKIYIESYRKASEHSPYRIEPLFQLACYYCRTGKAQLGYDLSLHGLSLQKPLRSQICYYPWIYEYGLRFVFAECAFLLDRKKEASEAYQLLLIMKEVPEHIRQSAKERLKLV
ncbi:MAG: glycosyltransferase [Chlamydiales bacterium]|nr:glycosyltransferase [Chlamydiales bacterium]